MRFQKIGERLLNDSPGSARRMAQPHVVTALDDEAHVKHVKVASRRSKQCNVAGLGDAAQVRQCLLWEDAKRDRSGRQLSD